MYSIGRRYLNEVALTKTHSSVKGLASAASNLSKEQEAEFDLLICESMGFTDRQGYVIVDTDQLPGNPVPLKDHTGLHPTNVMHATERLLARAEGAPSALEVVIRDADMLLSRKVFAVHIFVHDSFGCDDSVAVAEVIGRVVRKVLAVDSVEVRHLCSWFWNKRLCQGVFCEECTVKNRVLKDAAKFAIKQSRLGSL